MRTLRSYPKRAALAGFLLPLPFISLFLSLLLGLEPRLERFDPTEINGRLGTFIVLGAFLLMLAGFVISLVPVVRAVREGRGILAHALNLALCGVILVFILMFAGGIIIDQYPCWMGVPNCD